MVIAIRKDFETEMCENYYGHEPSHPHLFTTVVFFLVVVLIFPVFTVAQVVVALVVVALDVALVFVDLTVALQRWIVFAA